MTEVEKLKKDLLNTYPEHDSPVGVIHPYWARKPLNIIEVILTHLSKKEDIILDPFMGSGTTIFGALKKNRRVIGSDLNPLSYLLVEGILSLSNNPFNKMDELKKFVKEFSNIVLPWFKWDEEFTVERERFFVDGDFTNGNFKLSPVEVVLKKRIDGKWRCRTSVKENVNRDTDERVYQFLKTPLDFSSVELLNNSRIAVPEGAKLSHFYSIENQAAINVALRLIEQNNYSSSTKKVLKLLLSSSLTLLRLSDKKASSQWPYWRPKSELTTRNPAIIFEKRLKKFISAAKWLKHNVREVTKAETFLDIRNSSSVKYSLYKQPIQELPKNIIPNNSVDLILTDPPYTDQVPYLEYSALWIDILNLGEKKELYEYEIVETDAPERELDDNDFKDRFKAGLKACANMLNKSGYLVLFYQDWNLQNWNLLYEVAKEGDLELCEIISIPKQRRSMKTVTSPGKTLDGDQILIFKKTKESQKDLTKTDLSLQKKISKAINQEGENADIFEKYSAVIKSSMKNNWISDLAAEYEDFTEIIK